jgi:hypothetical protein
MKVVYVLSINDGMLVFEKLVSLVEWFKERGVEELKFEGEESKSIEDGIGFMLSMECNVMCKNEELFERGDDYCDLGLKDCELI